MDSHLKSFEFKGHVPRVPEHFSSSSSVLQERIYKELFVEDEDKDRSVVRKKNITDGFQQSYLDVDNKSKTFCLSDEKFSSFQQAFHWCQLHRYKTRKTFADQVLEVSKYQAYCYVCNCHGAECRNERKIVFQSNGLDSYEVVMYERGQHASMKSTYS